MNMDQFPIKAGKTLYAKDLWTMMAETKYCVERDVLQTKIEEAHNYLLKGVLAYGKHSEDLDNTMKASLPPKLSGFVLKLSKLLDLHANQAYDLLVFYLLHEFRGTQHAFHDIVQKEEKMNMLLLDMWGFYYSERLFLLKSVNLLLCYYDPPKKVILKNFFETLAENEFMDNLLEQYETLVKEEFPVAVTHGQLMTGNVIDKWFESHLREEIEILHNMILYAEQWGITAKQFERIVKACCDSKFGEQYRIMLRKNEIVTSEYAVHIGYLQHILLLLCFNLSNRADRLQWNDILMNCNANIIASLGSSLLEAPLYFTWSLVKILVYPEHNTPYYQEKLGRLATDTRIFEYFEKLLDSPMFKDHAVLLSTIIYRTLYNFIIIVARSFDKCDLTEMTGYLNLIGPILHHPKICESIWNNSTDPAHNTLLLILIEKFPEEFVPFLKAATALVANGREHLDELNMMVTSLDNFAKVWSAKVGLTASVTYEIQGEDSRVSIPLGPQRIFLKYSSARCTWIHEYNIFKPIYFEHQSFIWKVIRKEAIENEQIEIVTESLNFLKEWIIFKGHLITQEELTVVEQIFALMACLNNCYFVPTKILGGCVDIMSNLLKPESLILLDTDELRIRNNVLSLKIFPFMLNIPDTIPHLSSSEHFCSGALGEYVAALETERGSYHLLKSYLSFLHKLIKSKSTVEASVKEYLEFILPGLVYILKQVFPCYSNWTFSNDRDFNWISLMCMNIFHEILTLQYLSEIKGEKIMTVKAVQCDLELEWINEDKFEEPMEIEEKPITPLMLLQKVIVYNLLNMDSCCQVIRIISSGESAVQYNMEKTLHWFSNKKVTLNFIIRLSMSVLNRVFLLRKLVENQRMGNKMDVEILSSCEHSAEDKVILPTLMSLMSYLDCPFCVYLPMMSLTLLTTISENYPRKLYQKLGMEAHVIRDLFLKKLRSKLETPSFKESLLFLIGACADNQPLMCQAIFHIDTERNTRKYVNEECDAQGGCLLEIIKIFDDVREGRRELTDLLFTPSVECIVKIFTGFAADAAEFLRYKLLFWHNFCSPFLNVPRVFTSSIVQMFTLASLEVFYYRKEVSSELHVLLRRFFSDENSTVGEWFKLLAAVLRKEVPCVRTREGTRPLEKMPLDVQLLLAMKRFFMISVKFLPLTIATQHIIAVGEHLMSAMHYCLSEPDQPGLRILAEIYLFIVYHLEVVPIMASSLWVGQLEIMIQLFSSKYDFFESQDKTAFLSVLVKTTHHLSDMLGKDQAVAQSMLASVKDIVLKELNHLVVFGKNLFWKNPTVTQTELKKGPLHMKTRSAELGLCLLHKLLVTNDTYVQLFEDAPFSFMLKFLVIKFGELMCLNKNVAKVTFRPEVAEHIMRILTLFAKHDVVDKFLIIHVEKQLFMQLLPPQHLGPIQWLKSEWAISYKLALDFITYFVSNHDTYVVPYVISFVAIHSECLVSAILAVKHTFDANVMRTSISALNLVRELGEYRTEWENYDQRSLNLLGQATTSCLSTCISYLTNASLLRKWLYQQKTTVKKVVFISHVCNELVELTFMSLAVLQNYTPRLNTLMTDAYALMIWTPILELNFNNPFIEVSEHTLTYGALIALSHLCIQAITKTIRVTSPGVLLRTSRMGLALSSSIELNLDKHRTSRIFEMCIEMITSQTLMHLLRDTISDAEKESFQNTLNTDMTFLWVHVERIYNQKLVLAVRNPEDHYITCRKYLPFLKPTKNKALYERKPHLDFSRSPDSKMSVSIDDEMKDSETGSEASSSKKKLPKEVDEPSAKFVFVMAEVLYKLINRKTYC